MSLRVLMYGWEFPPYNSGGLGTACLGLTRALAEENAKVIFVLPKMLNIKSDTASFRYADIDIYKTKIINSPLTAYTNYESYDGSLNPNYGGTLFEEVMRYAKLGGDIAKNETFDIIHAHDWLSFGAGIRAKELTGKPLIVHVHATEFDRTGGNGVNSAVYDIEKRGMEVADKVITVSQYTKDMVISHYGIDPNKIEVVHNGIEPSDFEKVEPQLQTLKNFGYKIVLFLGRITLQKGPDYFIEAAKKVLDRNNKVLFIIVGSGDMEKQVINQAAKLGISDHVLLAGFLRGVENQQMYASADLYVLPSVSEPFGITPLESLMNGTPVLISKQSGVKEVIKNSLTCDFWDTDEMANKILSILDNPVFAKHLASEGKKEVKKVTWGKAAKKCVRLYKEFIHSTD